MIEVVILAELSILRCSSLRILSPTLPFKSGISFNDDHGVCRARCVRTIDRILEPHIERSGHELYSVEGCIDHNGGSDGL